MNMKKVVLVSFFLLGLISLGNAQEIGVRLGQVSGGNVAVDGIFGTGKFSRLHADVSFGNNLGIDLLWDFLYRPINDGPIFWYVGAGAYTEIGNNFHLGATGEIGLEYHFMDVPIAIGLDYRPYFQIIDQTNIDWGGFGLNIRFVFP